ncbi:MAG: glycosyltransferase family 9 protein [Nitrospira sp.]|nr:glycosyltransferase family 9 protein [Nitrospira sp.]
MPASQRTILVIHPGGLGDVLLSIGAMAVLRSAFPQHKMILLAGSDVGHLLGQCGVIDQSLPIESSRFSALFSGRVQISDLPHDLLRRCDLVVGWLSDRDGSIRRGLQEVGVPRVMLQSPADAGGHHQSDRFLETLKGEFPVGANPSIRLRLPDQVLQAGMDALRAVGIEQTAPLIMCHPGSGSTHKCVRAETWGMLIRGCQAKRFLPVMVLGPADEQAEAAIQALGLPGMLMLRPPSITMLAAILAQAQGYIGHDSGVTHLAALLGVPTVAMFGPTDERQWAPRGEQVTVVRGGGCLCVGWDAVRVCAAKSCLNVMPEKVFEALDTVDFRYRRVTNS